MSLNLRWIFRGGGPWWFRWPLRFIVLAGIFACGFIPYPHEVGGKCQILPVAQRGVRAQIDDEIVEVHVREGDWVTANDTIATLSLRDVNASIERITAELAGARATLELLKEGARPEDVNIAEQKVEIAHVQVSYDQTELKRVKTLVRRSAAPKKELQKASQRYEISLLGETTAKQELDRVKSGAREQEIEAAEANVRRLKSELDYNQTLSTLGELRAPINGRVVTPNIEERKGQYVKEGDLITTIHDDSTVTVEMAADESAAVLVSPGADVQVRLHGTNGKTLMGTVDRVSPRLVNEIEMERVRTDKESWTQEVVKGDDYYHARIYIELSESDKEKLSPGMTGYARIHIADGVLWKAISRQLERFYRVEVWSWLP